MGNPVIEVDNISMMFNLNKEKIDNLKEYVIKFLTRKLHFTEFWALRDISFSLQKGERLGVLGFNGAGKSTLMNVLIGLYQPTEGKIFLNGKEVRIDSPAQAVKLGIGMVHQHFMLVEAMTVFEGVGFSAVAQ